MANLTRALLNETHAVYATQDEILAFKKDFDDIFLIFNAIIVSFMQAGFACLEAGAVRTKNATSILMKNLCDMFIALIAYYIIGYAVAYGGGGNAFMGLSGWVDIGLPKSSKAFWFFQFIFSATAATILSGAVAERCHFVAYIVYTFCISGFVYPVVSHWAWSDNGWLNAFGYQDFAGSGVVHALAGVCCFVGAAFMGPRKGRFVDGKPVAMPGHNLAFVGIGALVLISGFLAFNAGSLGHISRPGDSEIVSVTIVNTVAGGSGALIVALIVGHWTGSAPWPFSPTLNAVLAGMVSTCGGPDVFPVWGAMVIGCLGALIYFTLARLLLLVKVDDPLEATAVHFGGGSIGVLMRPIFAADSGILFTASRQSFTQLYKNAVGLSAIILWSLSCSCLIFGCMKLIGKLRISDESEDKGADIVKHGEMCYPPQSWTIPVTPSNYDVEINDLRQNPKKSIANGVYKSNCESIDRNLG